MMDERTRRVGLNEALFRTVNDQVRRVGERFAVLTDPLSAICECGRIDCNDRLDLPVEDYERIRSDPTLFIVRPGHVAEDVESVVERQADYWVVRKDEGDPAELARRTREPT